MPTDYRDVYVAACGQVFPNHTLGRNHERTCRACLIEIHNENREDFEDHYEDEGEDEDE